MAWNEDGWRLARATHHDTRQAVLAVEMAREALLASDPEQASRLARAASSRATRLEALGRRLLEGGEELPTTEVEARRLIAAAREWKAAFGELDSYLAEQARLGRQGLTLPDHGALGPAGWTEARRRIANVPWGDVARLQAVPIPTPPAPVPPRDPTRPPPRRTPGWILPALVIAVFAFSSKGR